MYPLPGILQAAEDFAVLGWWNAYDYYNHLRLKHLPKPDLSGLKLEFDIEYDHALHGRHHGREVRDDDQRQHPVVEQRTVGGVSLAASDLPQHTHVAGARRDHAQPALRDASRHRGCRAGLG